MTASDWPGRAAYIALLALILPPLSSCDMTKNMSVASVEVWPQEVAIVIALGDTRQFTATLRSQNRTELTGRPVAWRSDNPDIVRIDAASGLATAVAPGTTLIMARSEGREALAVVVTGMGLGFGPEQFSLIPAGTFQMGGGGGVFGRLEQPQHTVTLTRPFLMQRTEVTQGQWQEVMGTNPSYFHDCGDLCPVEQVSWDDIQRFLRALNAMDPGKNYRLPTEAEWEYAARAGTTGDYGGTGVLGDMGWYRENSSRTVPGISGSAHRTHPVARKLPNNFFLYDMHGNVREFVQDPYGTYGTTRQMDRHEPLHRTDPSEPATLSRGIYGDVLRVLRGGGYLSRPNGVRSGRRQVDVDSPDATIGFRLVRDP